MFAILTITKNNSNLFLPFFLIHSLVRSRETWSCYSKTTKRTHSSVFKNKNTSKVGSQHHQKKLCGEWNIAFDLISLPALVRLAKKVLNWEEYTEHTTEEDWEAREGRIDSMGEWKNGIRVGWVPFQWTGKEAWARSQESCYQRSFWGLPTAYICIIQQRTLAFLRTSW